VTRHLSAHRNLAFVDTNVLVYAHDTSQGAKHDAARDLVLRLWADRTGALSTQVLQEFYVVATRKLDAPMPPAEARQIVALYAAWSLVVIDTELILDATIREQRDALSFWDALIVEAARRAGAHRLLSEDLQDGRDFDGTVVENPFRGL
jgi:predicted nucleic acid-binding protein